MEKTVESSKPKRMIILKRQIVGAYTTPVESSKPKKMIILKRQIVGAYTTPAESSKPQKMVFRRTKFVGVLTIQRLGPQGAKKSKKKVYTANRKNQNKGLVVLPCNKPKDLEKHNVHAIHSLCPQGANKLMQEVNKANRKNQNKVLMVRFSNIPKLWEDKGYFCEVCRKIAHLTNKILVQCRSCQKYYHADCHVPPISSDNHLGVHWQCLKCKEREVVNLIKNTAWATEV